MPASAEISYPFSQSSQLAFRAGIDTFHQHIIYPLLTSGRAKEDREVAHERANKLMRGIQEHAVLLAGMRWLFSHKDPALVTDFAGITLPNPLGIAAGLDKRAETYHFLGEGQGFGFVTVGSLAQPYDGNPRPRIFHHEEDNAYTNRLGFPGDGVFQAEQRLRNDQRIHHYELMARIGGSKPSFEAGTVEADMLESGDAVKNYVAGTEYNLSSPNTEGVRGLQEPDWVRAFSREAKRTHTPFWYKLSPDLPDGKLADLAEVMVEEGVSGIALTNTTTNPDIRTSLRSPHKYEVGGVSGNPLTELALHKSRVVYEATKGKLSIQRAGGVRTTKDMWNAMTTGGADVVEVLTAYVEKETSTPNFSWYMLTEFKAAMEILGITDMAHFRRELKGRRNVPYPFAA